MKRLIIAVLASVVSLSASIRTNSPAKALAQLAREADTVVITFYDDRRFREVTFTDDGWIYRLAAVLERAQYSPRDPCFCTSYPLIHLQRAGKTILALTVHHEEKLRFHGEVPAGDYFVGEEIGTSISDLAEQKKEASKKLPVIGGAQRE